MVDGKTEQAAEKISNCQVFSGKDGGLTRNSTKNSQSCEIIIDEITVDVENMHMAVPVDFTTDKVNSSLWKFRKPFC